MQIHTNSLYIQISTEQLENLTAEVKEILATDFYVTKTKTFTVADLWNIQRKGKSRRQRKLSA